MRGAVTHEMVSLSLCSLVVALGVAGVSGEYGWNECVVSPQDEWKRATEDIPALQMRYDYKRRYTCEQEKGERGFSGYYGGCAMPRRKQKHKIAGDVVQHVVRSLSVSQFFHPLPTSKKRRTFGGELLLSPSSLRFASN